MRKLQLTKDDWAKIIDGTKNASQVAKIANTQRTTVYYVAKKYNLPLLRELTDSFCGISREVIEMELQTMTVNDVAKKYNFSASGLKEWCYARNIGFTTTQKVRKVESVKVRKRTGESMDMIKYLMQEFTDASIARVFGYSKERIRQIRNEMGLDIYKKLDKE